MQNFFVSYKLNVAFKQSFNICTITIENIRSMHGPLMQMFCALFDSIAYFLELFCFYSFSRTICPANIYLFKVAIETLEKGVKYVQN